MPWNRCVQEPTSTGGKYLVDRMSDDTGQRDEQDRDAKRRWDATA